MHLCSLSEFPLSMSKFVKNYVFLNCRDIPKADVRGYTLMAYSFTAHYGNISTDIVQDFSGKFSLSSSWRTNTLQFVTSAQKLSTSKNCYPYSIQDPCRHNFLQNAITTRTSTKVRELHCKLVDKCNFSQKVSD